MVRLVRSCKLTRILFLVSSPPTHIFYYKGPDLSQAALGTKFSQNWDIFTLDFLTIYSPVSIHHHILALKQVHPEVIMATPQYTGGFFKASLVFQAYQDVELYWEYQRCSEHGKLLCKLRRQWQYHVTLFVRLLRNYISIQVVYPLASQTV